jgi:hypothetical protein
MNSKHLENQIASFLKLMKERGYDGHFLCNASYPGKLEDSLTQHLGVMQERTLVQPFFLTTYSHWQDEQSPYVQCDFKVRHSHSEGFTIEKMDIIKGNYAGKIKKVTLLPATNADVPNRAQANGMVMGSKRKHKIR